MVLVGIKLKDWAADTLTDPEPAKFIIFFVPDVMFMSALLVVIFIVLFPRAAIVAELLFDSVILRPVLLDPMRRLEWYAVLFIFKI
jgi:hypothetical protein